MQHGQAVLVDKNEALVFQPEVGFSGKTQVLLQAASGEMAGKIISIEVKVSRANLLTIYLNELTELNLFYEYCAQLAPNKLRFVVAVEKVSPYYNFIIKTDSDELRQYPARGNI